MFRGTFEHTVDEKGRVSVPSRFRELLQASEDGRVVITNFSVSGTPCLDVYPLSAWQRLEEQLRTKPQFHPQVMNFILYYVSRAHDCDLDRQGRILLPPTLREFARLQRDVVFTSALDKFRIWDREAWGAVFSSAETAFSLNPELLGELGI